MVSLIYTTTRDKKIKVHFDEFDQIWVAYGDLKNLLNSTNEEIEEQRNNLLKVDADNPICMEKIIVSTKEKYYSLFLVIAIGRVLNETETTNLMEWYNTITKEHDIKLSEEFNENLAKAIKSENK